MISLEQHLAEKVHAYTRTYSGGRRSSRPKDLVDMLLIQSAAHGAAAALFDPVLQGLETGLWSPLDSEWTVGE